MSRVGASVVGFMRLRVWGLPAARSTVKLLVLAPQVQSITLKLLAYGVHRVA